MKELWKAKGSKFSSLVSMIALSVMLLLFALALPEFFSSTAGRIFAGVWAVMVIAAFWAHTIRLSEQRRHAQLSTFHAISKKEGQTRKDQRSNRTMRG